MIARVPAGGVPAPGTVVCLRVSGDVLAFSRPGRRRHDRRPGRPPDVRPSAARRPSRGDVRPGLRVGLGDVRRAGRAASTSARAELGPTRRLVLLEAGNDVETVVTLPRRPGRPAPGAARCTGRRRPPRRLVDRYQPDVVHAVGCAAAGGTAGHRARPAPGPRGPAQHVGLHRVAQAGPSLAGQRRRQRPQHRDVPRHPRRPTGRSPRCRCTTATACRCSPATWSAEPASCSPTCRSPTPASGTWRRGVRRDQLRRRALHLRAAGGLRLPRADASRRCATSPRPAAGWSPRGCGRTPSSVAAAAGTCSSCTARPRPPPGWPTSRPTWPPCTPRPSASRSRRFVPGGRRRARRRRRAGLHRAERDDGLRRSARRPGARRRAHRAAHRRPGAAGRRRAVGDRGPARPAGQAVRAAARPRPGRAPAAASAAGPRGSWRTTTGCGSSRTGRAAVERTRRRVLEADRAAGLGGPRGTARQAAAHGRRASPTTPRWPARPPAPGPTSRRRSAGRPRPTAIRDLYAVLLGRPDATTRDSFVDLGGDSLSYVEASTRLGQALGHPAARAGSASTPETLARIAPHAPPLHGPDRPVGRCCARWR